MAVIIDLFSRSVIGWSMSKSLKKSLVCDSLTMAIFSRKFPKKVLVHSDHGSQYCSKDYKKILQQNDLVGSMSRKGNCWDNAPSESFFHTLKIELIHGRSLETRAEAKQQIFNYSVSDSLKPITIKKECTLLLTTKHLMKWSAHDKVYLNNCVR